MLCLSRSRRSRDLEKRTPISSLALTFLFLIRFACLHRVVNHSVNGIQFTLLYMNVKRITAAPTGWGAFINAGTCFATNRRLPIQQNNSRKNDIKVREHDALKTRKSVCVWLDWRRIFVYPINHYIQLKRNAFLAFRVSRAETFGEMFIQNWNDQNELWHNETDGALL